jgi:hypothetical protein
LELYRFLKKKHRKISAGKPGFQQAIKKKGYETYAE